MRIRPWRITIYLCLCLLSLFYLMPVYVVFSTSFKTMQEVSRTSVWQLPSAFDWSAYKEAFRKLGPGLLNSVRMAVPATIISAFLGSMNGYVLAKWKFRGADVLFPILLFGMFIPYQSILIPMVRFLQGIRLYGSIWGLVLVHVVYGIPMTTLLFRNYYVGVPTELVEAAKIDGASLLGIYRHIMLPISAPGFVVVMIWQFTSIWNEFLFAVTVTNNPASQPATVALQGLAGGLVAQWHVQMAGAVLTALPTLLVYIFLGKYFVQGLLAGSLKG